MQAVAFFQDFHDDDAFGFFRFIVFYRFVKIGIEGFSQRVDFGHTVRLQKVLHLFEDHLDPDREIVGGGVFLGRRKRKVEVVHYGDDLGDQVFIGVLEMLDPLFFFSLTKVFELSHVAEVFLLGFSGFAV